MESTVSLDVRQAGIPSIILTNCLRRVLILRWALFPQIAHPIGQPSRKLRGTMYESGERSISPWNRCRKRWFMWPLNIVSCMSKQPPIYCIIWTPRVQHGSIARMPASHAQPRISPIQTAFANDEMHAHVTSGVRALFDGPRWCIYD